MGDEDTIQPKTKQPQRRSKIIIRKCKKTSQSRSQSKSVDDIKKVNGELSNENKGKDVNDVELVPKTTEINSKALSIGVKRRQTEDNTQPGEDESSRNTEKIDDGNSGKSDSSSIEFKGYKKRILAQTEKLKDTNTDNSEQGKSDSTGDSTQDCDKLNTKSKNAKVGKAKKKGVSNNKKSSEGDSDENQAESQAEYAQYLGLQPTMQFKCYRCGEKGFPSMLALNMHQRGCGISQKSNFITNIQQETMSSADPNMLTNFRITRKVYLCSACGTYYENWNLFLHMRDVHKKHICLFCLTMFGMADKLADHLKTTHSVQESSFNSREQFQNAYKGSCYLICCSCENMFNEREDYFHHQCVRRDPTAKCKLCGVKCGHYYTCPNSNTTRTIPTNLNVSQTTVTKTQSNISKQPKQIQKNKTTGIWMGKKSNNDNDDDYDISHAASFCHVDLADESGEKDKGILEENIVSNIEEKMSDDNDTLKVRETVVEELKSMCTGHVLDEQTSMKDDMQSEENQPERLSTTTGKETILLENTSSENIQVDKTQEEKCESNEDIEEESPNKASDSTTTCDMENSSKSESPTDNDLNQENNFAEENQGELCTSDENTKELSNNNDIPEGNKSEISDTLTEKVEETNESLNSDEKPSSPSQKDKSDCISSDTDEDHTTHLSAVEDNTNSSSDTSSNEETTDLNKGSVESHKDDSACDSDDSDKSGLIVDEKTMPKNNTSEEINVENTLQEESFQEPNTKMSDVQDHNSIPSNDVPKDFHLDDVPFIDKAIENYSTEENDSYEKMSDEIIKPPVEEVNDGIPLASEDVPAMALTLEDRLDETIPQSVIKECVRTSCLNCVYCSHAIKIAVNGKQLALHLLAEHRYKPVKNNETSHDVVKKLKDSLTDLEPLFFNTDSYDSSDKSLNTTYDYTYECFQCRFVTKVHKELYVHKRKMHQKTVLLCVMCKSNFYSYSELLCHMCPGIYASDNINFRCCFCNLDMIPSAFRLMVHLRKSHHTCDICLEVADDQQKLSTHMWKHKLNHLCYRCGIAYRNKPDITKHLFWKHGTESVLCKKCLQKKWPHVYHFCIPPTVFICEECNASFTKAVALKVHKRFHGGELPYGCSKCGQKFVSKKLLSRHEDTHIQLTLSEKTVPVSSESDSKHNKSSDEHVNVDSIDEISFESPVKDSSSNEVIKEDGSKSEFVSESKIKKKKKRDKDKKEKPVVDVYDLPPLNLSSESDSSEEDSSRPVVSELSKNDESIPENSVNNKEIENNSGKIETCALENVEATEENQTPVPIVDGVWDNFHSYKAELEKRESKDLSLPNILPSTSSDEPRSQAELTFEEDSLHNWALMDHSYCMVPGKPKPAENEDEPILSEPAPLEESTHNIAQEAPAPRGHSSSIDHAYATLNSSNAETCVAAAMPPEEPSLEERPVTPSSIIAPPQEPLSSSKKKQKTPKKKKHVPNSSSSSDSSSDTDSTSCSCGPNCSCSSSSSNSSSSSSSDSESSTSEGRRRAAARREKKKEKLKHKHHKEEPAPTPEEPLPSHSAEEEPIVDVPVELVELPIRESDLDTDESSTDEDFYDKYPQQHAKQQMEKRNKLMLLASVAPVNNGTVSPPQQPPPVEKPRTPSPTIKRKIKTKRRRKSQQTKKTSNKSALSYPDQPSTSVDLLPASSTPPQIPVNHLSLSSKIASPLRTPVTNFHSDATAGSGSENESARLSKRKRVRNKFYGYSSEEEEHERPGLKWRKMDSTPLSQLPSSGLSFQHSLTVQRPPQIVEPEQIKRTKTSESSGSDEEPSVKKENTSNSSSSSCESEHELDTKDNIQKEQTEKSDNLYCYCQCPYDEVSEMIACDGQDCTIEWFHFECVGIMVPPKGKWYCPDCRKRRDLM